MSKKKKMNFNIDKAIIKDYIDTFYKLYHMRNEKNLDLYEMFSPSIKEIHNKINEFSDMYPKQKGNIYTDIIKQLININNGILLTSMLEPLNISRNYLSILEKNNEIERVSRGIYVSSNIFEDSYYTFQQKYKKAIFSHMNDLYFYDLTEEFPHNYTITVPRGYHVDKLNKSCNIFYVSKDIYKLGLIETKTPSGNIVKAYDIERCICDIINAKGRMDFEQVKKVIKKYLERPDRDIVKLQEYAKKMNINNKVMRMVGYYE